MSFPVFAGFRNDKKTNYKKPLKNLKKVVSLQVQKIPSIKIGFSPLPEKMSQSASLTIEAAFSGTLFLMFSLTILFPLHFIGTYEHIQAAMEKAGRNLSVYAYTIDDDGGMNHIIGPALVREMVMDGVGKEWLDNSMIRAGAQGVSFDGTTIMDDEVDIKISYYIDMPFMLFYRNGIQITQQCTRRRWTGSSGGESNGGDIEMVYVTPYGSVFHRSLACRHLNVSVSEAGLHEIGDLRNDGGSKYYPCSVCGTGTPGAVVFITDYGTRYHYRLECRELSVTVRRIPLNSTALPACKRCG